MPKGRLEFNLGELEDLKGFKRAVKATDAYLALWGISNEIFRPHRKHGYDWPGMPRLEDWSDQTHKVVECLEDMFFNLLNEYDINLDEELS